MTSQKSTCLKLKKSERDLSRLMMQQWGKFIKDQMVDWAQHPKHGYFDINGLVEKDQEAHAHRFV